MDECTLGSVAVHRGLTGGPFGSDLVGADYVEQGVPVVRGNNMGGRLVGGEFAYVTPDKFRADLEKNAALPGDLIFTQRGTLGQVATVPEGPFTEYVVSQSQMRLRVNREVADPAFVYYACCDARFRQQVHDSAISTGVPHINLGILSRLTVPLPPVPDQRAIAEVLGTLDDKIAVNTRRAVLMDELVRARFTALRGEPRPLADLASNSRRQVDPAEVDPSVRYVGLEHVPRRHAWLDDGGVAGDATSAKTEFEPGDVLFGKLRPNFHKVVAAHTGGICSTDILVLRARDPALRGYLLAAASADSTVAAVVASVQGTRMPRTNWPDLGAVGVPWPGEARARAFSADVEQMADLAGRLADESAALARTRDQLLPLLLSGRARVADAARDLVTTPIEGVVAGAGTLDPTIIRPKAGRRAPTQDDGPDGTVDDEAARGHAVEGR